MKDAPKESIQNEVEKMLSNLDLEEKAKSYSTELSGGMKRKLSVAIAFIGNSTTVILDEPTAGTDSCFRNLHSADRKILREIFLHLKENGMI